MKTVNWNNTRLISRRYPVNTASGRQLGLQRLVQADRVAVREGEPPPVLFMVPGFLQDARLYFPGLDKLVTSHTELPEGLGLAPWLASQGFDVFIAELSGKGSSTPGVGRHSQWGLHDLVVDDMPNQVQALAGICGDRPQIWLGSGLGSLLLSCCYARLRRLPAPVSGMVHFSPVRHLSLCTIGKALRYSAWQLSLGLSGLVLGYQRDLRGQVLESRKVCHDWIDWLKNPDWTDPVDNFDYRRAFGHKKCPPSLYIAREKGGLWGQVPDCRRWLEELGPHDSRLLSVGKTGGSLRHYNAEGLLNHPQAMDDHLQILLSWLQEINCKKSWKGDDISSKLNEMT